MNARRVALMLAVVVAGITTGFLWLLVEDIGGLALAVAAGVSASATYIVAHLTLEFLVFRELENIRESLEQLKDGDLGSIEMPSNRSLSPLADINDEIFSYATLKQREIEELKKLESFRREFLADVSHELKTPIFAAQGFVHTLLDGAIKDKSVRKKFLKKAAKSLDGLDALVQDLLTISQMETGQIRMYMEHFDLQYLIEELLDQLEGKAEKRGVTLHFSPTPEEPIIVLADRQRIGQVVMNLISNGIKYCRDVEGEVWIDFEVKKRDVIFSVKDNGPGISQEHLSRIFERFYRIDKSRSKESGGTGLGLAIVKHILEGHSTTISVTSTLGKGSMFSFRLPKGLPEEVEERPLAVWDEDDDEDDDDNDNDNEA